MHWTYYWCFWRGEGKIGRSGLYRKRLQYQNWKVRAVSQETAILKLKGPGCIARDCNIKIGRSGLYRKRLQYQNWKVRAVSQETAISKLEGPGCIARDCNIKNALYQYYFGQCPLSDVKKKRIVFNITLL